MGASPVVYDANICSVVLVSKPLIWGVAVVDDVRGGGRAGGSGVGDDGR